MLDFLNSPVTRNLERSMDATALRSQLIAHNLANVNTPNYKRVDLDFASVLADATATNDAALPMTRTDARHLSATADDGTASQFQVTREWQTAAREDGNNVDVEFEMARDAENTLHFQALAASWKQQISRLKMAIEGK